MIPSKSGLLSNEERKYIADFVRQEDDALLRRALQVWGPLSQIDVCIEECAELITALQHLKRGKADIPHVIAEIADVQIMARQMALEFGTKQVALARMQKLARLRALLEKEESVA